MRRHGALLAQALQRARPFWAGGGDALGASADLHRRGAQRCYRCGGVALCRRLVADYSSAASNLLDEPTNHLDIAGQERLESAIIEDGASCILVSHDRSFVDAVGTTFL